jgi:hypothetical protein
MWERTCNIILLVWHISLNMMTSISIQVMSFLKMSEFHCSLWSILDVYTNHKSRMERGGYPRLGVWLWSWGDIGQRIQNYRWKE